MPALKKPVEVLVVDDDLDLREVLSDLLSLEGYHVVTFSSGMEVLKYLMQGATADLILLDLMLPEMNGWRFLEVMATESKIASIPVVLMTASRHLTEKLPQTCTLLYKPVRLEVLLATIANHLALTSQPTPRTIA